MPLKSRCRRFIFKRSTFLPVWFIFVTFIFIVTIYIYIFRDFGSSYKSEQINHLSHAGTEGISNIKKKTSTCLVGNFTQLAEQKIYAARQNIKEFTKNVKKSSYFVNVLPHLRSGFNLPDETHLDDFILYEKKFLLNTSLASVGEYYYIGKLLKVLQTRPIISAENANKGSQLKLLLNLKGGVHVVFKPKWYDIGHIIEGPVFSGKDRHYGEIIAFYLSYLMDMPRVPLVVSRTIDLEKEIIPFAGQNLLKTFLKKDDNICFYGICIYCKPEQMVCGKGSLLEGVVTYYLSEKYALAMYPHPWRRNYKCNKLKRWEIDPNYCTTLQTSGFYSRTENKVFLLDLVDMCLFDFLIDNGDRHSYEFIKGNHKPHILLLDNGKSFGNPNIDHIDILAPLYQCCMLRKSTWISLLRLKGMNITKWLRFLLDGNEPTFKLPQVYFDAMERRLVTIFATLTVCSTENNGIDNVLIDI